MQRAYRPVSLQFLGFSDGCNHQMKQFKRFSFVCLFVFIYNNYLLKHLLQQHKGLIQRAYVIQKNPKDPRKYPHHNTKASKQQYPQHSETPCFLTLYVMTETFEFSKFELVSIVIVMYYQRPLHSKTSTTTSTRFSKYYVVLALKPASFWRENVVAFVILLRVLERMSWWRKQDIKCQKFYHFAVGRARNFLHLR